MSSNYRCSTCGHEEDSSWAMGYHLVHACQASGVQYHSDRFRYYVCPCGWESDVVEGGDMAGIRKEMERLVEHTEEKEYRCAINARCQRELSLL